MVWKALNETQNFDFSTLYRVIFEKLVIFHFFEVKNFEIQLTDMISQNYLKFATELPKHFLSYANL